MRWLAWLVVIAGCFAGPTPEELADNVRQDETVIEVTERMRKNSPASYRITQIYNQRWVSRADAEELVAFAEADQPKIHVMKYAYCFIGGVLRECRMDQSTRRMLMRCLEGGLQHPLQTVRRTAFMSLKEDGLWEERRHGPMLEKGGGVEQWVLDKYTDSNFRGHPRTSFRQTCQCRPCKFATKDGSTWARNGQLSAASARVPQKGGYLNR